MDTIFLAPTAAELEREWGLGLDVDWHPEVARGKFAPFIRRFGLGAAAQREVVLGRFGLIPASAKSERPAGSTINARVETADTRSAFKGAYAERRWCIIPALALYVPFHDGEDSEPIRWRIRRADRAPLAIAGLWDRWVSRDGCSVVSFAMLTINCDLHPLLSRFGRHCDANGAAVEKRTPVLLAEEDFDAWLDTSPSRAPIYFGTFGKDDLEAEPMPSNSSRATRAMALDSLASSL